MIGLDDLPDNFRVHLDESIRKMLFKEKTAELVKILNISEDAIRRASNGKVSIKVSTIKKLSVLANLSISEIEKHIIGVRTSKKRSFVSVRLPISPSPEMATLVGHGMGDGSLSQRQFSFSNIEKDLIDEVIFCVKKVFSSDVKPRVVRRNSCIEVEFPKWVGRMMEIAGVPSGKKVFTSFDVPNWIISGDKDIKRAFIRALFDDEGWIKVKKNKRTKSVARMIGINMAKTEHLLPSHFRFLNNVRKMLIEFGINPQKVVKMGKTKNGISAGFIISNKTNLKIFLESIGFTCLKKMLKLINCLDSTKTKF